jgi:D-alanyl-D-alanine endopeptidase (penicillin-binding protein 7)
MLAAFVFFSANTVYFVEGDDKTALRVPVKSAYHLNFDHVREKSPFLNVKAAIAVNFDNGEVLYAQNADTPRPVASISKLVTAMVLLDSGLDLDTITATITKEDAYRSSRSRLRIGYELTLRDLLYCALLNSDNRAARAISRVVSGSYEACGDAMTRKARTLGLTRTVFREPTGLDSENISTAHEVARILHYARDYDLIARITSTRRQRVTVVNKKRTYLQMANTNLMVLSPYRVLSGKTGYIRASDYCLTTLLQNNEGERVTLVVLGVPGDRLRFKEARKLANWAFGEINRKKLPLASK